MDESLAFLLAGMLTFVFGWNNSSILIGNQRGSGTLSARESVLLCSIGMILGVALDGSHMRSSLSATVSGPPTDPVVLTTLVVSVILTLALTVAAIPVSFSNTMVGAFVGAATAASLVIRQGDLSEILAFWFLAPLATMPVTFLAYRAIEKAMVNWSLLRVDAFNRAGVGMVSIALAYVLSANNVGLILGTAFLAQGPTTLGGSLPFALALAGSATVAMTLFGRGNVAGTVGDRLLSLSPQGVLAAFVGTIVMMWVATQLSIPISVTQCLIGGMFGAAFTKKIVIVNRRLSFEVVASWVVVPLGAFVMALVVFPLV
jgi:phosphate/sulfate permease